MSETQPRVLKLEEILTPTQLKDVESIIAQVRAGSTRLDSLRFYLHTQEETLAGKEIDPSYLFYAVAYAARLF